MWCQITNSKRIFNIFPSRWVWRTFSASSVPPDGEEPPRPPVPKIKDEHPFKRTWRILKSEMQSLSQGKMGPKESEIFPSYCDIAIIGGGIMGCSVAYWLKQRAPEGLNVVVIEKDPTYVRSSTALSVGGVRQQFSNPENIQLSMSSSEFLRNVRLHLSCLGEDPPDINFQPHGYLCLASEKGVDQLKINYQVQKELGAKVELLTPPQLKETFPWIHTGEVELGCYGIQNEGWFDPWCLLKAFKEKAISFGTKFVDAEVVDFEYKVNDEHYTEDDDGTQHPFRYMDGVVVRLSNGEHKRIKFAMAVLAAGANSGAVGKLAKIGTGPGVLKHAIPVEPRKRYVYVFHCVKGPGIECPLLIDPTGAYFRREGLGGNYICGKSPLPSEEPSITNLDVDYSFFEKQVWPIIANRVPAFEAIKLKSAWAGYYDYNTFDQNGIIGPHPYYGNLLIATGFSGHGIQQAPAVGRAIMELIIDGDYQTIDLSRLGFERIIDNEPLFEQNIY